MPDLRADPLEYCVIPISSFWDWNDGDETLQWKADGSTIVFRSELDQVLRTLVSGGHGLPPLSFVLLVLAACRDSWDDAVLQRPEVFKLARFSGLDMPEIGALVEGLNKISQFSPELRHPIEAKAGLLAFLFETGGTCRTGQDALEACDTLLTRQAFQIRRPHQAFAALHDMRIAVPHLLDGLDRLDEETFRLRRATGLDDLLRPARIDPDAWQQTRSLISSLLDDRELGGLACTARALMAAVHMPRPLWEPEELPMGGFSDIENRGSLDRLLISELAHDDLTLAVRIALNEALYLRREAPPKTPSLARSILIDVGIRMWGIPRVFATAAALAFLATTDQHTSATVYRARGNQIERAELATRQGLTEHLGCLAPDVHPGRAVAPFLAAVANEARRRTDCIIVTSEEAAADLEFQQCVARQKDHSLYLATVNRDGDFRLLHQGPHTRKVICAARLPLDDLLARRGRRSTPLMDAARSRRLPAIFHVDPFPLLIPGNRSDSNRSWVVPGHGVFEITADHRFLWWNTLGKGPRQLLDRVPTKAVVYWGDNEIRANQWTAVLRQRVGHYQRLTVDMANRSATLTRLNMRHLPPSSSYSFCAQEDRLVACASNFVVMFDRSGEMVEKVPAICSSPRSSQLTHRRSRYYVDDATGAWYGFCWNGPHAHDYWQKIFDPQHHGGVRLVTMLDWIGHEGPVGITERGELWFPEDGRTSSLMADIRGPINVLDVSSCGEWVLLEDTRNRWFVNVSSRNRFWVSQCPSIQKMTITQWVQPPRGPLHRRFIAAGGSKGGEVALVSRSNRLWILELNQCELRLRPSASYAPGMASMKPLNERVRIPDADYYLNLASWPDGSQAYLDSRGLLHLRSSDPAIPETTLVLADGAVAGWCADGRVWGNAYYTGSAAGADVETIYAEVLKPFVERLTW